MRSIIKISVLTLVLITAALGVYHTHKPLPAGLSVASPYYSVPADQVFFYSDRTYLDEGGDRVVDHQIFDRVFEMIDEARSFIVLDMFLFNDWPTSSSDALRPLSDQLTERLIQKKDQTEKIEITLITDPLNLLYGNLSQYHLELLEANGINVIITDLDPLRDSNFIYSAIWRTGLQWWSDGWLDLIRLPNVFDPRTGPVPLSSYLELSNFKANHRKVVLSDSLEEERVKYHTLVTSANPQDASAAHSNIAFEVQDRDLTRLAVDSELAVANMSNQAFQRPRFEVDNSTEEDDLEFIEVALLTEGQIKRAIINDIEQTQAGDEIRLIMFYLSDMEIIEKLARAAQRQVEVSLLLDPNLEAFGREKNGIPNREAAAKLTRLSEGQVDIRWCVTTGEQCHEKIMVTIRGDQVSLLAGSANFTRRNLADYNLETDLHFYGKKGQKVIDETLEDLETKWNNKEGRRFSTTYNTFARNSWPYYWQFRLMESSGLSTF